MAIEITDEALAARALKKDEGAFSSLYERYFDKAYDLAVRVVASPDQAADIAQDAFLKLLQLKGPPPANFRAWFYTIVRHQAIDALRKRHGTVPLPSTETDEGEELPFQVPDPGPAPEEMARNEEISSLVWEAARGLSPGDYTILDLHLRKGLETEELAQVLNTSKGNVYTMISRLKDSFEESLSALIMTRQGKKQCPALAGLLPGGKTGESGIDPSLRRRVTRHVKECQTCQKARRRYVTAAELLAAVPPVLPTPALREQVLGRLLEKFGPTAGPPGPGDGASATASGDSPSVFDQYSQTGKPEPGEANADAPEGDPAGPAEHPQTPGLEETRASAAPSASAPSEGILPGAPVLTGESGGQTTSGSAGMPPGDAGMDPGFFSFLRRRGASLQRYWRLYSVLALSLVAATGAFLYVFVIPSCQPVQKIVFHRYMDDGYPIVGNFEIFIMMDDGTGITRLTKNTNSNMVPHTSAAGRITFASFRDGNWEIYTMDGNGANQTRMTTNPAWDYWPNFSHDGTRIVFASERDGNPEIYVMNAAPNAPATRLTNHPAVDKEPHFSYDGKKIVFTTNRDGNNEIYIMDSNGANQTRLTYNKFEDHHPTYTPNGKILFTSNRDGNYELYIMDAVPNAPATRLITNGAADDYGRMKPNGTKIAFVSNRDGNDEIYKMNPNGASQQRLTNYLYPDGHPDWIVKRQIIVIPTPRPSPTAQPTPTLKPTRTPPIIIVPVTPRPRPTAIIIPIVTPRPSLTPPPTPTPTPTPTPPPTLTPPPHSLSVSPSPSPGPSPAPKLTPSPTPGPSPTPLRTPTATARPVLPSNPQGRLERPVSGSVITPPAPIEIEGWALDSGAATSTGVDQVKVFDGTMETGVEIGLATYGLLRTDVGETFGSARFNATGFKLSVSNNIPKTYLFHVYAHSTVSGSWYLVGGALVRTSTGGGSGGGR